jgi:hypothetical protein
MIVKNAISNGYTFLESIRSIVDVADEFLISDGYSEDGTYDYLELAASKFGNIKLFRDHWPVSENGEAIAEVTNRLKARAKCQWIYNLQADEVIHEVFLPMLRILVNQGTSEYRSFAVKFLHFVGDFKHIETKPGYGFAVRLAPNREDIFVAGDGWTFDGAIDPFGIIEDPPLFHFGWVYAKNSVFKRKNQATSIYSGKASYQKDYELCQQIESEIEKNPDDFLGWQRKMLCSRKIRRYKGGYPKVAMGLLERGNIKYDPDPDVLDIPTSQLMAIN